MMDQHSPLRLRRVESSSNKSRIHRADLHGNRQMVKPQEELLTAVRLACGAVVALPHVEHMISVFLFQVNTSRWTLETASERGFARLLDRLLQCQWA